MKRWLIPVAALALIMAACSGESSAQVASLEDTATIQVQDASTDDSEVSEEEALLAFAACMRENGVEDFEDPDVSADGGVQFNFRGGGETSDVDRDVMREAMEICRESIEGFAFGPGGGDFDETEIEDQLVEFAACMREQGIEMDDPDLSSFGTGGQGGSPFGDLDFQDEDVQAAMEVCQGELAFGPGGGAGGGGRGGGEGGPPDGGGFEPPAGGGGEPPAGGGQEGGGA